MEMLSIINQTLHRLLRKSIQYSTALTITGAINSSLREKLYQELGLERLEMCRWYRSITKLLFRDGRANNTSRP